MKRVRIPVNQTPVLLSFFEIDQILEWARANRQAELDEEKVLAANAWASVIRKLTKARRRKL